MLIVPQRKTPAGGDPTVVKSGGERGMEVPCSASTSDGGPEDEVVLLLQRLVLKLPRGAR
ncbi:hypothetical protein [Neobacillus terrae]|uniref:hypothetical protein n=1 Tax=Neobacillus terrae TaxID=3034837 RepID=UPI00140E71A9|nr:hypothetical protein [Neobacillus terrae]NHM29497.1 hypothetical protein [Neobacillus terrae]